MGSFHNEAPLFLNLIIIVSGLQFATSNFSQVPFVTVWNAPTASCLSRYGVDLDLGTFSIVQNENQTFMGENITIFYSEKLGLYPSYTSDAVPINGGLPQNASLNKHLAVASENIRTWIPNRDFQGLAVVDWESWRPLWVRNWDSKHVYQLKSIDLVRSVHPDWSPARLEAAARADFERAGRMFMEQTLTLGQQERPKGLWGFYGFPDCFNYYSNKSTNYTGECPAVELARNDKQLWLWNVSSALYPSIYLGLELRHLDRAVLLYSRHRIMEAMRVGDRWTPSAPPVFPYARIVYTYTPDFLSQEHLAYTVGESAALGSAGVVLWGDSTFSKSRVGPQFIDLLLQWIRTVVKTICETIKSYIDNTLGRYLVNVTAAAFLCSKTICSSHGRCQRRNSTSSAYLHLDPAEWKVVQEKKSGKRQNYTVFGQMSSRKVVLMTSEFQCRCFPGWGGESCSAQTNPGMRGFS